MNYKIDFYNQIKIESDLTTSQIKDLVNTVSKFS